VLKECDFSKKTGNRSVPKRIFLLLQNVIENPYLGLGKPEMLKANLAGCWIRRITEEHRLVYKVSKNLIK